MKLRDGINWEHPRSHVVPPYSGDVQGATKVLDTALFCQNSPSSNQTGMTNTDIVIFTSMGVFF